MPSPSDALRDALQRALAEAKFDLGRVTSRHRNGHTTAYAQREGEVVEPACLRKLLTGPASNDQEAQHARSARVCLPNDVQSDLACACRRALKQHHDPVSDSVGHAFPMVSDRGGSTKAWPCGVLTHADVSSIETFSAAMTKWAAVLGVSRVIDLLAAWTEGQPLAYNTCAVVGLTLEQRIRPTNALTITPLPLSTAELPRGLPERNDIRRSDYLGHALLSVSTIATPALFCPASNPQHPVQGNLHQDLDFDLICHALSLECDACIDTGVRWNDYGDLSALVSDRTTWGSQRELGRPVGWRSSSTSSSKDLTTIKLLESSIRCPSEDVIHDLLKALGSADSRTRIAVDRWKKSMNQSTDLTNRFIDLRIALESLFLPQTPDQQMKFRLATNGAWLVASDGTHRRKAWDTLRAAYDAASKAVHRGRLKETSQNCELLANAQTLCRNGLLRILRDGPVEDWNALILDAPARSSTSTAR